MHSWHFPCTGSCDPRGYRKNQQNYYFLKFVFCRINKQIQITARAIPLGMMQEINRSSGNLELDWFKDNQKTDYSIPTFYTIASGEPPLPPSINVTTQRQSCWVASTRVRDQSQPRCSVVTYAAHSSHLVCICHALSPAAVPPAQSTNQKMLLREPRTLPQAISSSAVVEKTNTCNSLTLSSAGSWEAGWLWGRERRPDSSDWNTPACDVAWCGNGLIPHGCQPPCSPWGGAKGQLLQESLCRCRGICEKVMARNVQVHRRAKAMEGALSRSIFSKEPCMGSSFAQTRWQMQPLRCMHVLQRR